MIPSRFSKADETWHNYEKGHFCHCKPSSPQNCDPSSKPPFLKRKDLILGILTLGIYCNMSKCNGKNLCLFLLMLKCMCLRTLRKRQYSNLLYALLHVWHTLQQNKSSGQILIKNLYLLHNLRHWEEGKRIAVSYRRIKQTIPQTVL